MAPVPDEIDDDVGAEFVAEFGGQSRDPYHRIYIFRVDVENRDRLAARDTGRET